jgi:hypothetical protein
MSTKLAATFPNANTIDTTTIKAVAKEGDFFDTLSYATQRELNNLKAQLEDVVRAFRNTRNPLADLCRMRLNQLRSHLKQAV